MKNFTKEFPMYLSKRFLFAILIAFISLFSANFAVAATKTSAATGNWSSASTWSPSGVPASGDDVIIASGHTITVDGNYTCNNLNLGNTTNSNTTLQITTSGKSLTINGDLKVNPSNKSKTFLMDAGPGIFNIAGTFSSWGTSGTNTLQVGTGQLNFTPAVSLTTNKQAITFTGAGSITFNGGFSDASNKLTTYSGCIVNFGGAYTSATTLTWNGMGTAVFKNGSSIVPTSDITFNNVHIYSSSSATISTGLGAVLVTGDLTIQSGGTLTANKDFEVDGNWINNGGTFTGNSYTVTLNGVSKSIGGTSSTTFNSLQIGASSGVSVAADYTTSQDITCATLILNGNSVTRTLTLGSAKALTVTNNLTIEQPSTSNSNLVNVGDGTCIISGNLNFSGTSPSLSKIGEIRVGSGTLTVGGSVNWMTNTSSETEIISLATGTINFEQPVWMTTATGTINVTGAGTINFNGATVPSFTFGGATNPSFTTVSGTTLNFKEGYSQLTSPFSFAEGTIVNVGSSSSPVDLSLNPSDTYINTATLKIHGNLNANAASRLVNAANATIEISGNISSNITLDASATGNTVKYNGNGNQNIKAASYYNISVENSGTKNFGSGTTVANNLEVKGSAAISNSSALAVGGVLSYSSSASSTLGASLTAKGIALESGTLDDGGNQITISDAEGWMNNGGTFNTTGAVVFSGSSASHIGGTHNTTFHDLSINNSGGVSIHVNNGNPTIVDGVLTLNNGILTSNSMNPLKLTANATASGGSSSSFVEGPMIKVGNSDFVFPIGKDGQLMKAGFTGASDNSTEVTAEFFNEPFSDTTSLADDVSRVSSNQYWLIERTVTEDPIYIQLYWDNATTSGIANWNNLTIVHYKDGEWVNETATITSGSNADGASGYMTTTSPVSTFSPFGPGEGGGALPIKLVSFKAVYENTSVKTEWTTALEINNEKFTVERSSNGVNFQEVHTEKGAGNSSVMLDYKWTDKDPLPGVSYYRLKQTDFDGAFAYSPIVAVQNNSPTVNTFHIYPNPTSDELSMTVTNPKDFVTLIIYDMNGREMFGQIFPVEKNASSQTFTVSAKYILPIGVYILQATTNGNTYRERLMLN